MAKKAAVAEVLPTVAIDTNLQALFRQAIVEANGFLIERRDEIAMIFVGLISGQHCMMVGPPGTAKSLLARLVCALIQGRIFDYQFNKYTAPEEVFGPLDIPSLTGKTTPDGKSKFVRNTSNMLPEADVAHLDELGKGSTAIRNTMLNILNEGEVNNGGVKVKCPLLFAIASANEWIGESDDAKEMGALFDRFLLRKTISPISTPAGRDRLLFDESIGNNKFSMVISPAQVHQARREALSLPWTAKAKEVMKEILSELGLNGIVIGDRRQRWSVSAVRAAAYLAGSDRVLPEHLEVLKDVLWVEPIEQPMKAATIILKKANPAAAQITKMLTEAEEIVASTNFKNMPECIASTKKLQEIAEKLQLMKESERRDAALEFVVENDKAIRMAAMNNIG